MRTPSAEFFSMEPPPLRYSLASSRDAAALPAAEAETHCSYRGSAGSVINCSPVQSICGSAGLCPARAVETGIKKAADRAIAPQISLLLIFFEKKLKN
ncbi:MAG: hypothetical protein IIZ03_02530 [Succinivibrionaceae bacterium]|nr:hypothetical protein [Succinivibrionaceae bacterium]